MNKGHLNKSAEIIYLLSMESHDKTTNRIEERERERKKDGENIVFVQ